MSLEEVPMKQIDQVFSVSQTDISSKKGSKLPQYLAAIAGNCYNNLTPSPELYIREMSVLTDFVSGVIQFQAYL